MRRPRSGARRGGPHRATDRLRSEPGAVRPAERRRARSSPADRLDGLYAEATGPHPPGAGPPGYGKSTQVAGGSSRRARHVGWIDVERVDNDPFVLASAVVRALTPPDGEPADAPWDAAFDGAAPVEQIAAALGRPRRADRPTVRAGARRRAPHRLGRLAGGASTPSREHLPSSSTLVLCGRSHPDQARWPAGDCSPGVVDVTADAPRPRCHGDRRAAAVDGCARSSWRR